jgi:hypothetical protein
MVQAAILKAKKLGAVEDVRHPIPEDELIRRGNVCQADLHFIILLGVMICTFTYEAICCQAKFAATLQQNPVVIRSLKSTLWKVSS